MSNTFRGLAAKAGLAVSLSFLLAYPAYVLSRNSGVPSRSTGGNFPAENTCANSQCHNTTPNVGPGSVSITLNGTPVDQFTDYAPNQVYDVIVTVAESGKNRFGFQMTARNADGCLQAGDFQTTSDPGVEIITDVATPEGCSGTTLEFPQHGFPKAGGPEQSFQFQWTAPGPGFGQVQFAAAGNAANGNNQRNGDSIYQVEAAAAEGSGGGLPTPMIFTEGGVRHGASLNDELGFAPSTFFTIFGTDLVTGVSDWSQGFLGNFGPTQLGGAQVFVNGENAFLSFVGDGDDLGQAFDQINAVAPDDEARGAVNVEVVTAGGTSNTFVIQLGDVAPGFFPFDPDGRRHVAALQNDFSAFVGPTDLFGGAPLPNGLAIRPAKPDDVVAMFFTGGGPTDPPLEAGRLPVPNTIYNMVRPITILIGGMEAEQFFAGLSGNVAVYQAVVRVPNLGPGLHSVVAEIDGVQSQTGIVMAVDAP